MSSLGLASYILDIIGTVAFAVAGAMVAVSRRMDLFGVLSMGTVTAMGGGVIRDVLLGQFPPRAFYNYTYIYLSLAAALVVFLAVLMLRDIYRKSHLTVEAINNIFDAIGLASFSVTGVQIAIQAGHEENWIFCVFLGMMTGVGGGILRDILCCTVPLVFTKHIYAVASIAGNLMYYLLARFSVNEIAAVLISMLVVIAIRMLATIYRWNLPRIRFSIEE